MAERLKNNAMYAIPDDPELSTYRFIIVAAKRARQLQNGARCFLPTTSMKPTVAAMEETTCPIYSAPSGINGNANLGSGKHRGTDESQPRPCVHHSTAASHP